MNPQDLLAGLAYGTDALASPLAFAVPNTPGGIVDHTATSSTPVPAAGQDLLLGSAVPPPMTPGWYSVGWGSEQIFGLGWAAEHGLTISPLFLANIGPQPFGLVPPSWWGLPDDYIAYFASGGGAAYNVADWLNEARLDVAFESNYALQRRYGIPITITEYSAAGLILRAIRGWLVDP